MRRWLLVWSLCGLVACQTLPSPRVAMEPRPVPVSGLKAAWPRPEGPLADRITPEAPVAPTAAPLPWLPPSLIPVEIPNRVAPRSRSWVTLSQPPLLVGALPKAPAELRAVTSGAPTKTSPPTSEMGAKSKPASKPVAPALPKTVVPMSPPTDAAQASLLPQSQEPGSDFQWQDVNATVGNLVTLQFNKTNWLYLDSPEQQRLVGFQSITRDAGTTTFLFKPPTPGTFTLDFQRQDVTNGSEMVRKVKLTVVSPGTRTSNTGTQASPQVTQESVNSLLERARQLEAAGQIDAAVQLLRTGTPSRDPRIALELATLLSRTGQTDGALAVLDPTISGPDRLPTLELGTKLATQQSSGLEIPTYAKLWLSGTVPPTEDTYLAVMDGLRQHHVDDLLEPWSDRYLIWFPRPEHQDEYLYRLAQWLETPGPHRDIQRAWKSYQQIVESYPLSAFWTAAGERSSYLNRHFLQVR